VGETPSVLMVNEDLIGIGRMARLSGLTVKALRYYDRVGLMRPAAVDAATGFRYYSDDQVPAARLVGRLRSMDVPLHDISDAPGFSGRRVCSSRSCIHIGDVSKAGRRRSRGICTS